MLLLFDSYYHIQTEILSLYICIVKTYFITLIILALTFPCTALLLYSGEDNPMHQEIPMDSNTDNEVEDILELDSEKISIESMSSDSDLLEYYKCGSSTFNLTKQYHLDLSDPPPDYV